MKNLPAGAMVELNPELIGEGDLLREIQDGIQEAHRVMANRAERGDKSGRAVISVEIGMKFPKDIDNHMEVSYAVAVKRPKASKTTLVKEKNGRLLCQPTGSSGDSPDQQRLFDAAGKPIGVVDRKSGEIIEENPVAGRVGKAGGA